MHYDYTQILSIGRYYYYKNIGDIIKQSHQVLLISLLSTILSGVILTAIIMLNKITLQSILLSIIIYWLGITTYYSYKIEKNKLSDNRYGINVEDLDWVKR